MSGPPASNCHAEPQLTSKDAHKCEAIRAYRFLIAHLVSQKQVRVHVLAYM